MKKALIIGGDSRLGQALCSQLILREYEVVCTSRRGLTRRLADIQLDLLDPQVPEEYHVNYVAFIVAAVTGIVRCEQRDAQAWRINADAPARLARLFGSNAVFVSSDAVEIAPHTAYAKQKAYAELAVLAQHGSVLRPSALTTPEAYEACAKALVDLAETGSNELRRFTYGGS